MDPNPDIHGSHHQSPKRSPADTALEAAYRRQYSGTSQLKTGQLDGEVTPSKTIKRKRGYAKNLYQHGLDFKNESQSSRTFWAAVSDPMGPFDQHRAEETTGGNIIVDLGDSDDESVYEDDFDDKVPLPTEPQPQDQTSTQVSLSRTTSVETLVNDDEIPSVDMLTLPSASFAFQRLDKNIQSRVLQFLLVRPAPYKPWYNYCSAEQPEYMVRAPNIDIPLVLVNKEISARATDVFYGENVFDFNRPEVSLWWLKRIGANISKIRHIQVFFTTGRDRGFRTSQEVLWLKFLNWIKRTQMVSSARVDFGKWYDLLKKGEDVWPEQTTKERHEIVKVLEGFGGLVQADVRRGWWLTKMQAKDLESAMMQGRFVKGG